MTMQTVALVRRFLAALLLGWLFTPAAGLAAEEQFFDSAGVKIRYRVQGQGEPVVLVHGFAESIELQWDLPGVTRALASQYQVIAFDNRGHGRSDKPHDPRRYGREMVEDVVRLLDHLKIERAHVVGYSMGGFIASKLLATHPERVLTVTLGGAGWFKEDDPRQAFVDELADSLEAGKGIGPLIRLLTPAGQRKPGDEELKTLNQLVEWTNDTKALAAAMRGMRELAVSEDQLRANQVPTLALVGQLDPFKETVDDLVGRMAELKVVVIDGADHITAFFRPEFVENLKAFLAAHAARPQQAGRGPSSVQAAAVGLECRRLASSPFRSSEENRHAALDPPRLCGTHAGGRRLGSGVGAGAEGAGRQRQ